MKSEIIPLFVEKPVAEAYACLKNKRARVYVYYVVAQGIYWAVERKRK